MNGDENDTPEATDGGELDDLEQLLRERSQRVLARAEGMLNDNPTEDDASE